MSNTSKKVHVVVSRDGPYLVTGTIRLSKQTIGTDAERGSETWIESDAYPVRESYALCRCGQSKTKPFCDGTHTKVGFDGSETASRELFQAQAKVQDGPEMQLLDAEALCAFARFCDPNGQVWNQVNQTQRPHVRETFIRQVGNCPSGRLVARERSTQEDIEPHLPVSIGLVEDPAQACSGPVWLRGRVPVIGADGFQYEVRNRVTLCRCGQSKNKPFCDGTHAAIKFKGDQPSRKQTSPSVEKIKRRGRKWCGLRGRVDETRRSRSNTQCSFNEFERASDPASGRPSGIESGFASPRIECGMNSKHFFPDE